MSTDLQIISELEQEINLKLHHLTRYQWDKQGYEFDAQQNIIGLNLHGLKIGNLPKTLKKFRFLKYIHLIGNNIRDISILIDLKQLERLVLQNNKIEDITDLPHLKKLTHLNIAHNPINDLSPVYRITLLKELCCAGNSLINHKQQLPSTLEDLWIGGSDYGEEKKEYFDCSLLGTNVNKLMITSIGVKNENEIGKLRGLKSLNISWTDLQNISFLPVLSELEELNLYQNKIKDLPFLKSLTRLKGVNLRNNQISNIAPLIDLNHIISWVDTYNNQNNCVNVYENPVNNPPIEIAKQGNDAIRNYFLQLKDDKDYLYEAKLLLVGEERAGKSTIADALRNPNFKIDLNKPSTQGMDISQWMIPCSKAKTPKDFRFNIWDFGGQEIYHATHQFFLTKRSLYLFITEARKDIRYDDFYYWLNIINTLAGDSPVILVQNKTDQDHKNQNIDEYRNLFPQIFTDLQQISCNTEHPDWNTIYSTKLTVLKENIYKALREKKLKGIGDELPKSWVDIRREISELQNQKINFISLTEYLDICSTYKLNSIQALHLSDYFHDLGVFLHFRDDIQLKDTIFINHEWVTKGIYNVFDSKKIKDAHGKFTNKDLMEIWDEPQFADKQPELLNLMKNPQFKICYQHQDGYYLAPQLFDNKPLEYEWKNSEGTLVFRYKYEFMPKGLLSQLIVVMHKYIFNNTFWLHGVIFQYKKSRAVVIEDRFGKKNLISIRVAGVEKKELLTIITSKIEEINSSYTNLKISEEFGCNCNECATEANPYFYSDEVINRAIKKEKRTLECQISFEEVDINFLLGNYIQPVKVERFMHKPQQNDQESSNRIIHRQEKHIKHKNKTIRIFLASSSELEKDRKEFREFISVENDRLNEMGIYLKIIQWEYFIDAMAQDRLQAEYNKAVKECDIFLSLFFTKVGKFTSEEFEIAFGKFKETGTPRVYTYFRKLIGDFDETKPDDLKSRWDFEEKLKSLGHFKSTYSDMNDLKNKFKLQLENLLPKIYSLLV